MWWLLFQFHTCLLYLSLTNNNMKSSKGRREIVPVRWSFILKRPSTDFSENSRNKNLAEAPLQPQVYLGMTRQALHIIIWQLSTILLLTSSPLSGWMGADAHFQVSPEIFDGVQAQAVAGLLKDIHRVVYKPLLLCALGHCHVRRWTFCPVWGSECSGLGFHYNLNILVHWVFLLLWRVSQSHSTSCYQHTSLLGCTLQVMSRAGSLQTRCFIRPENLVSQSVFHVSSLRRGLSLATLI